MKCEDIRALMIDIAGRDPDSRKSRKLNAHLSECQSCREEMAQLSESWQMLAELPEESPSPRLRQQFTEAFERELALTERLSAAAKPSRRREVTPLKRLFRFQPAWQFAATLLLLGIGFWGGSLSQRPLQSELSQLSREADNMRRELSLVRLDGSSAGERLQGVRSCAQLSEPGEELIERLLSILSSDDNIHVRLAAVDALYLFGNRPKVRQGVTEALTRQESPLMQVALIDLLVAWREKQAAGSLRALAEDGRLDIGVQKRAQEGLEKIL